MTGLPPELDALLSNGFWQALVVFLRVSALVSLLPAFGEQTVPVRVKLGISVAFTMVVAPSVPAIAPPADIVIFGGLAVTEIGIGLALGIGVRLFVLALQTAGSIAAQATSLSQLLGGASADPAPAMGHVLVVGGLALAVMGGLHIRAAELMIQSYQLFPAGAAPEPRGLASWGGERIARAFGLAFMLAAPFAIASLIYFLTLGVINRAMPQLMVAFVGAPVITLGGLFLLFAGAPLMLSMWREALQVFLANPVGPP